MPSTMFEAAKERIRDRLAAEKPGIDVRVVVERTPYGVWVWDEKERSHVQMKNQEIIKALGSSGELEAIEVVRLTWKDVIVERKA